jgi:hypothetical protein
MKTQTVFSHRYIPVNNLTVTLILVSLSFLFTGCSSNDEGIQWLLSKTSGSSTPVPDTEIIEGEFSLQISNIQGGADFLFDLEIGSTVEVFTIVLNAFSPADGSLVQIREMSGDQTGRVIFQGVPDENGNLTGSYSIDTIADEFILNFTYEGKIYSYKSAILGIAIVNSTFYINKTMEAIEPPSTNEPPIANAGEDQVVDCPACSIQLDGSSSSDPDDDVLTYNWTYGDST